MTDAVLMTDAERRAFLTPVPTEVFYPHLAREPKPVRIPRDPAFCANGHRRTPDNQAIYVYGTKTFRVCRLCRNEQQRAYLQRKRDQAR